MDLWTNEWISERTWISFENRKKMRVTSISTPFDKQWSGGRIVWNWANKKHLFFARFFENKRCETNELNRNRHIQWMYFLFSQVELCAFFRAVHVVHATYAFCISIYFKTVICIDLCACFWSIACVCASVVNANIMCVVPCVQQTAVVRPISSRL